jgi:peptidoglycan/xylan/chitin deacetylase (PgdA/CDA1 family)
MVMTSRRTFLACAASAAVSRAAAPPFRWPEGKRVAISLTFDDARLSQPDTGLEVLRNGAAKATFYLSPERAKQRADSWKKAIASGHEIGNHSRTHPCTGNYAFSRSNALEDYTLERMAADIDGCTDDLRQMFGVKSVSFAYPCGLKSVGRGENVRSYVPLVAKRFLTGRGYLDESPNDPAVCDLANLMGTGFDGLVYDHMMTIVESAAKDGRWIIFVGHEIGARAHQTTDAEALGRLCRFAAEPGNGVWMDTVAKVARYVKERR